MTVVDASVLVAFLLGHPVAAPQVDDALADGALAPELLDAEVLSVLVRQQKAGVLSPTRVALALDDLSAAPVVRVPHRGLLLAAWRRSAALSGYDALYVGLAAVTGAALLTGDARLSRAPGLDVPVLVVPTT